MPVGYPQLFWVEQTFPGHPIADLHAAVVAALAPLRLAERLRPGASVAVTAGSRGITDGLAVTQAVIAELLRLGVKPWVVPAMGSHGGATAAGQAALLAGYGYTSERLGVPVVSQDEVVSLGQSAGGVPLFADRLAAAADGILVINRVKPHTDFVGELESGPNKMLAIGLGKKHSAGACHSFFVERGYDQVLRDVGDALWAKLPVLGALGIVENAKHETIDVGCVRPDRHFEDEKALLAESRASFGYLPFTHLDVLLVDEIGKDISGTGMDANVTGADDCKLHTKRTTPFIWRIAVRGLTAATHGNATGVGHADYLLRRAYDQIDWAATYTNADTAASPEGARCPIVYDTDAAMLAAALRTSGPAASAAKRFVWLRNTLRVDRFLASGVLLPELAAHERCVVGAQLPAALATDDDGFLRSPYNT